MSEYRRRNLEKLLEKFISSLQDECMELADKINERFADENKHPGWRPIIFQTSGLQRSELIAHYLAMDIGVVTPKKVRNK